MLKPLSFKLASRIACLAVLMSAALWLNASARGETSFECVLSANIKTGGMTKLSCGTSAGDVLWVCPANGPCDSDPSMDSLASQTCSDYATSGCPDIDYYSD